MNTTDDLIAQASSETTGATASGFGPNRTSLTVDGARVTPTNAATAAIYQVLPREARGDAGGTWLFWNLWLKYTAAFQYTGAFEPSPEGGGIGEAGELVGGGDAGEIDGLAGEALEGVAAEIGSGADGGPAVRYDAQTERT